MITKIFDIVTIHRRITLAGKIITGSSTVIRRQLRRDQLPQVGVNEMSNFFRFNELCK